MSAWTMEAVCRRISGGAARRYHEDGHVTPGQYMEACAMLDEGCPPGLMEEAVWRLERIAWFRQAGIMAEPWDLTGADVERLTRVEPWNPSGQMDLGL